MRTFRALGALLSHPSDELIAALDELRGVLASEGLVDARPLEPLFAELNGGDLLDLQDGYFSLFDNTRSLSLHMYEHVWGDARERGQAMVRLQTVFALHGCTYDGRELPDYLPLFCEFLSLIAPAAARALLGDAAAVLEVLRERLQRRGSPYAAVLAALGALAARKPDPALLERISKGEAPDAETFDEIDRLWAEEPVLFTPETGCQPAAAV